MTVKAFGREVPRAGLGWHWIGPVAFDTSDMWLAGRWPRVGVGAAGLAANPVLAGGATLAARLLPAGTAAAALRQVARAGYALVLFNINPLLDYDGSHLLSDLLDRPTLRPQALGWLHCGLALGREGLRGLRGHGGDLLYAAAVLATAPATLVAAIHLVRGLREVDVASSARSPAEGGHSLLARRAGATGRHAGQGRAAPWAGPRPRPRPGRQVGATRKGRLWPGGRQDRIGRSRKEEG